MPNPIVVRITDAPPLRLLVDMFLIVLIWGLAPSVLMAQTATWDDAEAGDWFNASNWSPAVVPGSTTTVFIDSGGTAQISTAGAQAGALNVGYTQAGSLLIQDAGTLTASTTTVASDGILTIQGGGIVDDSSGAVSGTATIDGSGSTWTTSGGLQVAQNAPGTMTIENGASVSDVYASIGVGGAGAVTVSGAGSTWTSTGSSNTLLIGDAGGYTSSNSSLTILSGGTVSDGSAFIGVTTNGSALVDSSSWINSGNLSLGYNAGSSLTVQNGGSVSDVTGYIDTGTFANSALVTGTGSTWTNSGNLYVGYDQSEMGKGNLTIQSGGQVSDANGYVSFYGGTHTVTVDGSGSVWVNNGNLYVGYQGYSALASDSGTLFIQNGGEVDVNGTGGNGTGTLTIGTNTVGGAGTYILQIGDGGTAGTLKATTVLFGSRSTDQLVFDQTNAAYIFSPTISGSGSITQESTGTTILTGANTSFTGTTLIDGGEISLGSIGALGATGAISFGGGTLQFTSANTTDYSSRFSIAAGQSYSFDTNGQTVILSGVLTSNGGSLAKMGSGTLTLQGADTYSSTTTISGGTLALGVGGSIDDSSEINLTSNGTTFDISGGGNQTIMGLSGVSGSTVNLGANSLTINGRNGGGGSFAGVIQGSGVLMILANLATLSGSNTYTGATTIGAGSDLELNGGSISSSSVVNLSASGAYFSLSGVGNQTIQDLTGVSNSTVDLGTETLTEGTSDSTTFAGSIVDGAGSTSVSLIKQGTGKLTLTGANTYIGITTINAGTLAIGTGGSDAETTINLANSGSTFDISAGGSLGIEGLNGVSGSTVSLGANTLTVSQSGGLLGGVSTYAGIIQGTGGLIKSSTGTLLLSGANTYTGATTISNGTVQFGQEVSLYDNRSTSWTASNLTVSAGATFALNVGGTGEFTSSDVTTLLQNLGSGTGGFASGSTIGFDTTNASGGNFTYAGAIADAHSGSDSLGLVKLGGGTLTLSGADTYSGATTIQAGTLAIGAGGSIANSSGIILNNIGTIFDISLAGNQTIGDLSGASESTVNLGANTLTEGTARSTTYSGTIEGSGGLIKQNDGTLTLAGNNTYTGGTIISSGEVSLGSSGALGTTGTIFFGGGSLQFTSANTLDYSSRFSTAANQFYSLDTNGQSVTLSGNLTSDGGILDKIGTGTLILTGTETYSGATVITAGKLTIQGTADLGSGTYAGTILNSGTFNYNSSVNQTLSGGVSGSGSLVQSGIGTLTLSGSDTYTGGTTVTLGKIKLSGTGTLGSTSGSLTVDAGGTIDLDGTSQTVGDLTGTGGTILNSTKGTNTTLTLGSDNGTGGNFAGTIENNSGKGGAVALTKVGTGAITLSGTNSYTGLTLVSAGTLEFANEASLYNDIKADWNAKKIIVKSGATLALNVGGAGQFTTADLSALLALGNSSGGFTSGSFIGLDTTDASGEDFTYSGTIANSGKKGANVLGLTKLGTNTLTLSGTDTYTGATTISSGALDVTGSNASSAVSVADGATLGGTGRTGFVTVNGGGIINLQDGVIGTLTVGELSAGNIVTPSAFSFDIQTVSGATTVDKIADMGTLTLNGTGGTTITIGNLPGSSTLINATNTYALLTYTGTQQALGDLTLSTTSLDGKTLSLSESGDTIYLDVATPVTVTLSNLAATYDGLPHPVTATTNPSGLNVVTTYNGSSIAPTTAGLYTVVATINNPSYASATGTLLISPARATVNLGDLASIFDGSAHSAAATATTNPSGLEVICTYNGSPTPPSAPGSYTLIGKINDANYEGSSIGTMVITPGNSMATDILP